MVKGAISLGVKRPGREADHSPPSSAEVKECVELYLHSPNKPSWRGAQLKHWDKFTFTCFVRQCMSVNKAYLMESEGTKASSRLLTPPYGVSGLVVWWYKMSTCGNLDTALS
jgi:hypothetical protein